MIRFALCVEQMPSKDKLVSARVPASEARKLEAAAAEHDLTVSQVLRKLVRAWLADPEKFSDELPVSAK